MDIGRDTLSKSWPGGNWGYSATVKEPILPWYLCLDREGHPPQSGWHLSPSQCTSRDLGSLRHSPFQGQGRKPKRPWPSHPPQVSPFSTLLPWPRGPHHEVQVHSYSTTTSLGTWGQPLPDCPNSLGKTPLAASSWSAPELSGPAGMWGLTRTVSTEVPTVTFSYKLILYSGWLKMGRLSFSLMRVIFTLA